MGGSFGGCFDDRDCLATDSISLGMRFLPLIVIAASFLVFAVILSFQTSDKVFKYGNGHALAINYLFEKMQELEKKCSK